MKYRELPDAADLRERFIYDPETGIMAHRHNKKAVGYPTNEGYLYAKLYNAGWRIHRLIWKWVTGDDPGSLEIDHINGVRADNRWCNLRLATRDENASNIHDPPWTNTGLYNLLWEERTRCFVAYDRKNRQIGRFHDPWRGYTAVRRAHGWRPLPVCERIEELAGMMETRRRHDEEQEREWAEMEAAWPKTEEEKAVFAERIEGFTEFRRGMAECMKKK